ncbi:TolC family protein [Prosthecobacter dejongeii]|uniref:Cobalt-zinc-cadmium efflux system outer membrane protein n=1 Tax=Prosthecobacter dejongeii TaxID=48465 RepID=A0A7W7YHC5_9BACT|nr:TolC family protein [Prosthecobacter dejongeii]MBB5036218.1 cobalt-zinc-cadmium efflux system outer membrane protein [Prosthecobacter dejongeii]
MSRSLLFLFCLAASSSASALSLSEIAPRVRDHHPQLKAARLAVEQARGRQLGAGRLANPTLGVQFQNESRVSPRSTEFSVDQAFPLTRRLTLEKQHSAQLVAAAELEVKDVERRLIAEARSLAVKLLALEKQRALRQQQTQLADKLSRFAKDRAAAGELSPLDAAQAQVDAQRLQLEARRLEIESVSLQGSLKPMLGIRPTEALKLTGDLPALVMPGRVPWQQRADYQLAQAKTEAAQTEAALAHARRYQDVSAGFFAAREQQDVSSRNTERTGFVGFRFSIPLPLWNRNQGEIAEKKASIERARLETEALATEITSEAETARQEMEANAALVSETRDKLLPLVKQQTDKLEKAYETGQTDLLTVLRAREQRLQLETAVLDASRDFHLARIRYDAAVGAVR